MSPRFRRRTPPTTRRRVSTQSSPIHASRRDRHVRFRRPVTGSKRSLVRPVTVPHFVQRIRRAVRFRVARMRVVDGVPGPRPGRGGRVERHTPGQRCEGGPAGGEKRAAVGGHRTKDGRPLGISFLKGQSSLTSPLLAVGTHHPVFAPPAFLDAGPTARTRCTVGRPIVRRSGGFRFRQIPVRTRRFVGLGLFVFGLLRSSLCSRSVLARLSSASGRRFLRFSSRRPPSRRNPRATYPPARPRLRSARA